MADLTPTSARIIFVDDDASFLQMIRDVFHDASSGAWDIIASASGEDALRRLRSITVDMAVIDVFMPGMDGLQLLRALNNEFPSLPKVLLTGMPDENTRAAALEGGAALFLEKPANAAGYASVFATLNELARWHQRFSSRGSLRRLSLIDLVRLECKSGNSRLFEVFLGDLRGEIYVKQGEIVHALMPDRRGQSAFTYLTTTPGSVFYLRQFVDPGERSITREWEFLVMETAQIAEQIAQAARVADSSLTQQPHPPAQVPLARSPAAPPAAPPAVPAAKKPREPRAPEPIEPAPAPEAPVASPVVPSPIAAPAAAPIPFPAPPPITRPAPPAPTPVEARVVPSEPAWQLAEAPDSRPLEFVPEAAGLKIEEMLLCSDFREVLFEQQCPDAQKRLGLGEALWHKSGEIARLLPLGEMDRAELQAPGGRLVARFEAKRCLFVRTNSKAHAPAPAASPTDTAETWLARQNVARGILAACVLLPDGRIHPRSFVPEYSKDVLQLAGHEAARLLDISVRFAFPAWQVRLLYSRTQVYAVRRQDGLVLVTFLLREGVDLHALQPFFDAFNSLHGA